MKNNTHIQKRSKGLRQSIRRRKKDEESAESNKKKHFLIRHSVSRLPNTSGIRNFCCKNRSSLIFGLDKQGIYYTRFCYIFLNNHLFSIVI